MSKQCNIKTLAFESHRRRVSAAFDGGPITSDVGPLGVSDPALPRLLGIVADRYSRYSTTSPIPLPTPWSTSPGGAFSADRRWRASDRAPYGRCTVAGLKLVFAF